MHLVFNGWVFPSLSYPRCISSPNLAEWSNITVVAPQVISSCVANGNAPSSTYRKSVASHTYVSFGSFLPVDKYCFDLW
jgi:hypothetical protein